MSELDRLRTYRDEILVIAHRHGVTDIRVFGSVARGEPSTDSDLDLLIAMSPDRSLLDHVGFQQDLEALLGVPVDVVTERGLHPLLQDRVLADARPL